MVKDDYGKCAFLYDFLSKNERKSIERMVNYLNIQKNELVLDVGCGTGNFLKPLLEKEAGFVVGLDLSPAMLYEARKKLSGYRTNLVRGDAFKLPFKDGKFDVLVCINLMDSFQLSEHRKLCPEFFRVLKPNGKIGVINFTNGRNIFSGFFTQFYNSLQSTPFYRHFFDLPLIGWFSPLRELRAIDTKVCLKDFFNVKLEDYVESPRVIHPSEILAGVKI